MAIPSSSSRRLRWFYLDDQHADYNDIITSFQAFSPPYIANYYQNDTGRDANRVVVRVFMSDAEVEAHSPTLTPAAANCVKDQFNYASSEYPFDVTTRNPILIGGHVAWSWGVLKEKPPPMPTTGEDRRIAHYKNEATETILYVAQDAAGAGDGTSYLDPIAVKDIAATAEATPTHDPTTYSMIVFSGRLSRFPGEGAQSSLGAGAGIYPGEGTADSPTVLIMHPLERSNLMGGLKLGDGSWGTPASWTDNGDGTWSITLTGALTISAAGFTLSDDGGTFRPLTSVASLALCQSTADSFFVEPDYSGSDDRITVHLESGNDPKNTTFIGGFNVGGLSLHTERLRYFEVYGLDFYQQSWRGSRHIYNDEFSVYGCSWQYGGRAIAAVHNVVDESRGFFKQNSATGSPSWPHAPKNRLFQGCIGLHVGDFFYDSGGGHFLVSENTKFHYCYTRFVGKDAFGITLGNTDNHSFATMGHKEMLEYIGNRADRCGFNTIQTGYATSQNVSTPVANSTTISNGTFTSDISGWTDQSTGSASISHDAGNGYLALNGAAASIPIAEVVATVAPGDQAESHVFEFWADASVDVRVGTTSGGTDILSDGTAWTSGGGGNCPTYETPPSWAAGWESAYENIRRVEFTPNAGTIYIQIRGRHTTGTVNIDNVVIRNLDDTEGFTLGYPATERKFYASGASFYINTPMQRAIVAHNWLTDPVTEDEQSSVGTEGRAINLTGDAFAYGSGPNVFIDIRIHDNIVEGDYNWGLFIKYIPFNGRADAIQAYRNIWNGCRNGFLSFGKATGIDDDGNEWDPCFDYHDNLHHNTQSGGKEVDIPNILDIHQQRLDRNHYSYPTGGSHIAEPWKAGGLGGEHTTLASWQSAAPAGDIYDPNSVVGEDLDLPQLPAVAGKRVSSKDP